MSENNTIKEFNFDIELDINKLVAKEISENFSDKFQLSNEEIEKLASNKYYKRQTVNNIEKFSLRLIDDKNPSQIKDITISFIINRIIQEKETDKTVRLFYIDGKEIYTESDARTGKDVLKYLIDNYELEYIPKTLIIDYTDSAIDDKYIEQIRILDEQRNNANSVCLG